MKYGGKRCVWCQPAHLMDEQGYFKPGKIRADVTYSDGLCKMAAKSLDAQLDAKEKAKKEKNDRATSKKPD
jgi:hypothetical protein